jgi:hypothetical protein
VAFQATSRNISTLPTKEQIKMAYDGEGTLYIPLEEFWMWVQQYHPNLKCEIAYGVPRFVDGDLVIDYAFSSDTDPRSWAKKPKCLEQWDALNKTNKVNPGPGGP